MLCFCFGRVKLCAAFSFFFVIALIGFGGGLGELRLFVGLCCCICHELGHIFAMSLFGSAPKSVTLYGGGIKIVPDNERELSRGQESVVLLSGCLVNLLLAAAFVAIELPLWMSELNLILCVFNLLPFSYFDGGRVLSLYLSDKAFAGVRAAVIALTAGLVIWLILEHSFSPSLAATFALVLLSEFAEERGK